jgi:hypothetical protein
MAIKQLLARPFGEAQICSDDHAGVFVPLGQQVKQQGTSNLAKREIAKFVQNDEDNSGTSRLRNVDLLGSLELWLELKSGDFFGGLSRQCPAKEKALRQLRSKCLLMLG